MWYAGFGAARLTWRNQDWAHRRGMVVAQDGLAPGGAEIDPRDAAEQLFASSTMLDVLGLLCSAPDRRFYVNELIRRSGRFPRSVQLALAKLDRAGAVRSERQANVRFYQIVVEHPFYFELSSICAKLADVTFPLRRAVAG